MSKLGTCVFLVRQLICLPDSEIVMVDRAFGDDFFQTKSVMGRLRGDDFRHLGHPPKLYRVQDAGFIDGSWS